VNPQDANAPREQLVTYDELFLLGIEALGRVGVPKEDAAATLEILLWSDLRGVPTHGIQRLLTYVPRLREGLINPTPRFTIESPASSLMVIDGDNGLGTVVGSRGIREATKLARETGIAFVGCRNSNHFGACAPYVLLACREGMLGMAGANAAPTMAPWGGLSKRIGNNPFAVGVPCQGDGPFVIDVAMSNSSRARIFQMASKKERIPGDWALDAAGRPTTDASEAIKGFVLPIGRHKGYGLAVAIDILCGILTGGAYSESVTSLAEHWDRPQRIGHFFMTIDVARFMPLEVFSERMKDLYGELKSARPIDPKTPVRIPGERGNASEKAMRAAGIPIASSLLDTLKGLTQGNYDYEIPKF
jgi:ureidoglycolate dehydrogenase (NAD+)